MVMELKKTTWVRGIGIILTISLISFIMMSLFYWANFPLQEVKGNTGGVFFWSALMLILLFKVNSLLMMTTDMIFYPLKFVNKGEGQ